MTTLTLNDQIVLALLVCGHCQGGFNNRDQASQELQDGLVVGDFETYSKDNSKLTVKGDNLSYCVDIFNLSAKINFYGKTIEIFALKHELDLANRIYQTFETQMSLFNVAEVSVTDMAEFFQCHRNRQIA